MHVLFRRMLAVAVLASMVACSRADSVHGAPASPLESTAARTHAKRSDLTQIQYVDAIVEHVLRLQYPEGFDSSHHCWRVTRKSSDGDTHYCMRTIRSHIVKSPAGNRLYISTSNANDIRDDNNYVYQSTAPGLLGVFEVEVDAAGPRTIAAANALEYGTAGSCGCETARFQRVGYDKYAWIFSSGGTWQGVTVSDYAIVVPQDGHLIDVADIPQITESAQDVVYGFEVDTSNLSMPWYPLSLTKRVSGKAVDKRKVEFDEKSHSYRKPQDL